MKIETSAKPRQKSTALALRGIAGPDLVDAARRHPPGGLWVLVQVFAVKQAADRPDHRRMGRTGALAGLPSRNRRDDHAVVTKLSISALAIACFPGTLSPSGWR